MRVLVNGPDAPLISDEVTLTPIGNIADAREWEVKRQSPSVIKVGLTQPTAPMRPARSAPVRPHVVT